MTIKNWITGARVRTLPLAVAPIVLGSASADLVDRFDPVLALLALLVALLLQIGVNYANDYSDGVRGTDDARAPVEAMFLGRANTDGDAVVCISHADAQDYAAWLSRQTGAPLAFSGGTGHGHGPVTGGDELAPPQDGDRQGEGDRQPPDRQPDMRQRVPKDAADDQGVDGVAHRHEGHDAEQGQDLTRTKVPGQRSVKGLAGHGVEHPVLDARLPLGRPGLLGGGHPCHGW